MFEYFDEKPKNPLTPTLRHSLFYNHHEGGIHDDDGK